MNYRIVSIRHDGTWSAETVSEKYLASTIQSYAKDSDVHQINIIKEEDVASNDPQPE